MKIAIIGGGFTGLTAAYYLSKSGQRVTLFEKEETLGGLAHGFKEPAWRWHLEKSYHHWFTNDKAVLSLIGDLHLTSKLIIERPVTANFWKGTAYQFDSPLHLLRYPGLTAIDKVRTGVLLSFLKANPFWIPFEEITAKRLGKLIGGNHAWQALWEPLMAAKFDTYAERIAASWLWARIKKRTPKLGYIEGGFYTVLAALEKEILQNGGRVFKGTTVQKISGHGPFRITGEKKEENFDKLLLTVPSPVATKLVQFPASYMKRLLSIPHLSAQTLVLETKKPIIEDTYWLSVLDRTFPFLAVVAHTNFMDKKYYGGHHLTFFGNYLPPGHPYLSLTKEQLLKKFTPFIKKLNSQFAIGTLVNCFLFNAPFAQPVHELHYSNKAPGIKTPLTNIYLANLDSIFPWDRGTNYAVELGQKAANVIVE